MPCPHTPLFLTRLCAFSLLSPLAVWGQVDSCKYHVGFLPVEINGRYYYYDTREVEEKTLVTYPSTHQEKEYACTSPVVTSKKLKDMREVDVLYRCGSLSLKNSLASFRCTDSDYKSGVVGEQCRDPENKGWWSSSVNVLIDTKNKEWKLKASPYVRSNDEDYVCDDSGRYTLKWRYYQVLDDAFKDAGTLRIATRTTQKLLGIKDKQKPSF